MFFQFSILRTAFPFILLLYSFCLRNKHFLRNLSQNSSILWNCENWNSSIFVGNKNFIILNVFSIPNRTMEFFANFLEYFLVKELYCSSLLAIIFFKICDRFFEFFIPCIFLEFKMKSFCWVFWSSPWKFVFPFSSFFFGLSTL